MGETINRTIVFTHINVGGDESVTSKGACENYSICEMMRGILLRLANIPDQNNLLKKFDVYY